ncbi:hypothetical protein B0H15DRAFT_821194 [Mycena belliarum]|uniref:Uncharacterized protein n=1 Tax=Mycena belliarum TaxID=1033014 RepID=A0AAD6UCL1_9AGAR|nr:hypothetical protein B0H15DRAFT_821194 [Mycena belliae]
MSQVRHFDTTRMAPHDSEKGSVQMEERAGLAGSPIQLTPAQYERLFFQPGGGVRTNGLSKPRQLGNPTAFAMICYLLALTPTSCFLMSWDGTSPTSFPSIVGVFYFIGGLGMTIGGVLEWVLGNTFPFSGLIRGDGSSSRYGSHVSRYRSFFV